MSYCWDCFRWRFFAAACIGWWLLHGAPVETFRFSDGAEIRLGRWYMTKAAWKLWRQKIMLPHERHLYKPLSQVIDELRSEKDEG